MAVTFLKVFSMLFRTVLRSIHKWIGLVVALLLLLQAVTGIALVYRDSIQQMLLGEDGVIPQPFVSPDIDGMLAAATVRYPDYQVVRMDYPAGQQQAMILRLQHRNGEDKTYLLSNPQSGAVIREMQGLTVAPFWVFELHKTLLSGDTGHLMIAIEGIALIFLLAGGIYLWWPSRKRPLPSSATTRNGKKIPTAVRRLELHRFCGFISAPLLLTVAFTGTVIAVNIFLNGAGDVKTRSMQQPLVKLNPIIEDLSRSTGQAVKDLRFSVGGQLMTVNLYAKNTVRPLAVDRVAVNLQNGRIETRQYADEATGLSEFYNWMYPIHSGKFLGGFGRLLIALAGVLLLTLAVLGYLLFAERRRLRRVQLQKMGEVTRHELS